MYSLRQYLFSLINSKGLTRTLGEVELCRNDSGELLYTVGNTAAIFLIRHEGQKRALRCYFRPRPNLQLIYGERFLPKELYLYETPTQGMWVDVVLTDWIEGVTLDQAIRRAAMAKDQEQLTALSEQFDRFAATLLADDWAHGDLKPENILIDTQGELRLIDHDACFLPAMRGMRSPELGTASFQSPNRTVEDFDERLDDYPAALIATALHALRRDPSLYARYGQRDGLLFDPYQMATDEAYREAMALFTLHGDAVWYRIAEVLANQWFRHAHLATLFAFLTTGVPAPVEPDEPYPELYAEYGRWGFRTEERVVIPPIYHSGFDFSEGLAPVCVGKRWHFIDRMGRVVLHAPPCDIVKPFRDGFAVVVCGKIRYKMNRAAEIFELSPQNHYLCKSANERTYEKFNTERDRGDRPVGNDRRRLDDYMGLGGLPPRSIATEPFGRHD